MAYTAQQLIDMGYGGYQGWGDAGANADFNATGGEGKRTTNSGSSLSIPDSSSTFTNYLSDFQKQLTDIVQNTPQVKIPTAEELRTLVTPTTPAPAPINRVQIYNDQRTLLGVSDLESKQNDLNQQIALLDKQYNDLFQVEQGKTVGLNVISGRLTEEQRQLQEKKNAIIPELNLVSSQLSTKYNIINTIVQYSGLDYKDAVDRYDSEFNNNLKMQGMLMDYAKFGADQYAQKANLAFKAVGAVQDQVKIEMQQREMEQNNAKANLTTVINSINSGSVSFSSLDATTKANIAKLEAQSGLPVGFVSNIGLNAKEKILFNHTADGITTIGIMGANGQPTVKTFNTGVGNNNQSLSKTYGGVKMTAATYQTKVSQAITLIDNIDKNYVTNGNVLEKVDYGEGDRLLSKMETEKAFQSVVEKFGGNRELANQAFKDAWVAGGFKTWGN